MTRKRCHFSSPSRIGCRWRRGGLDPDGSRAQDKIADRLGALYTPGETGEAFAERHRDSLLSRMIPAQSLAAGRGADAAFCKSRARGE